MNVQKRLVAAHHLDAPWRPSDLEQRNGRIIRQGNMFYERDPDNFTVGIFNYATKQTYDSRMWQCIEYKSAAIEQFRKGDLLQRVIDDVQSEAANAAEMKAAASGNPLILMQVQLSSDLRKLEALYSQHQRGQHRLRDRLKWLERNDERLAKAEAVYKENIRNRDTNTRIVTEKGKEKIYVELRANGKVLTAKDNEQMRDWLIGGVKEVTRNASAKVLFGVYRGFDIYVERLPKLMGNGDGFRLTLKGAGGQEFKPNNLVYSFDEKFSLAGLFQRMDNFLAKGLDDAIEGVRAKVIQEKAELETVRAAMGKEFPQKDELALVRENHNAVIRELQRMQDQPGYVSTWTPKTSLTDSVLPVPPVPSQIATEQGKPRAEISLTQKEPVYQKLEYSADNGRIEYSISNQHNGHTLDGFVVRRTFFNQQVGSLGLALYEDGQWRTTSTAPRGMKLMQYATQDEALLAARTDARSRNLQECTPQSEEKPQVIASSSLQDTYHAKLLEAGFHPTGDDFFGKHEYASSVPASDGGTYCLRLFQSGSMIGLRSSYEKGNIIDGRRTVKATFENLDKALEFVSGYHVPEECRDTQQQSYRMRM